MTNLLTSEPESDFVCSKSWWMRLACIGLPFYKEHEGKRYCVLHFPGKEKSSDFEKAFKGKLKNKDFNFSGVWFPDRLSCLNYHFDGYVTFSSATFSAEANFYSATFDEEANFSRATFSANAIFADATFSAEANFRDITLSGCAEFMGARFTAATDFTNARFTEADFSNDSFGGAVRFNLARFGRPARFANASFGGVAEFGLARFSEGADFESTTFSAAADFLYADFSAVAYFGEATFRDYVKFAGSESGAMFDGATLDLQFARIEKPDHLSFHTLRLRPHWFVNVDARRFSFTNIHWGPASTDKEVMSLRGTSVSSPHDLMAIAYRNLAVNAEENQRYEEASKFRFMAMDARRREKWRGFAIWRLSWWYWLASGYGERAGQAFGVLLGIFLLSALLYSQVGFVRWEPKLASESDAAVAARDGIGKPLPLSRALAYSAAVITFQKPEPRPATMPAQVVVLFETILGPIQAALLALAIRRKFMR